MLRADVPEHGARVASQTHPVIPGAEPWSHPGSGDRARIGVVVTHGFTGNPVSVRPLAQAVTDAGYRVEVPRLPGHGTHHKDMAQTRYGDWRAHLEEVVHDLAGHCEQIVLTGLSMGGTLSLDVGSRRQDVVRGIAPINTAILDREGLLARFAPYLAPVLPFVPAKAAGVIPNDIAKPGGDERAYTMVPAKAANSMLSELPRIRQQLREVQCPVLVLYSPQDHTVPPKNSLALEAMLGTDDVTVISLDRSYHVATLDWDADLIASSLLTFIERVTD
ncbi:MAG TPA: alpha/beta fold hydrolase [Nitriliruptorales bacterium]